MAETLELPRCWIEPRNAGVAAADPERSGRIELHRAHAFEPGCRAWLADELRQRFEFSGNRIAPDDAAAVRCKPKRAARVDGDVGHVTIGEATRIGGITWRMLKRVAVEAIETVFRADPEKPCGVFGDGVDRELRQPGVAIKAVEVHGKGCARGSAFIGQRGEQQTSAPVLPEHCASVRARPTGKPRAK